MRVWLSDSGRLKELHRGAQEMRKGNQRALNRAAQQATTRSRAVFQGSLSGRPHVPKREGRPTTGGGFTRIIRWQKEQRQSGTFVAFQIEELEGRAPYWLIQEIGTGKAATILDTGEGVSVQSQRGRLISPSLVWADAVGNYDVPRLGSRNEQLMSLKDVKNLPLRMDLEDIRIKREIAGKHYIQRGGREANEQYRTTLIELAKRVFR